MLGRRGRNLGDQLLAVVVVDGDGVDGAGAGGELRVEFGVVGYVADEHALLAFLAVVQDRFPGVLVPLEGVPLRDALEHPDAGVAVVLDSHTGGFAANAIEVASAVDDLPSERSPRRFMSRRRATRPMTDGSPTAEDARRAVADALPDERVVAVDRVAGGTNTLYCVATDEGGYVVKFNTFVGLEITAAEVAVYRLLADADVPVPRVVDAVLDPADGSAYFVMTALPGEPPVDVSPALARRMGCMLREFPSVDGIDGYGRLQHAPGVTPPVTGSADTWREYVDWYVDMLLAKPANGVADLADPVRGVVDRTLDAVPRRPDPAVVPDDYRPANLHVADGEIVGVLDLERAARGDLRLALVKSGYLLGRGHSPAGPVEATGLRSALYAGFDAEVPDTLERCYRAAALASEIRGFDVWWDDPERSERAAELRSMVGELAG